jgi:hypothetical protein
MTRIANIINHIVLVLDASLSMSLVSGQLIKVADNQIAYLAGRSKEMDQETRITVYTFSTGARGNRDANVECLIYDKDVLRVPSISGLYKPSGMTPLIDATMTALDDLAMTPEKYGEHSFLIYVLTDGQENASRNRPDTLSHRIAGLPDHWTVATFVPNQVGVHEAKRFGFPAANIAIWDATTAVGVFEAGEKIRQTTENFMVARAHAHKTGTTFRGSRSLFSLNDVSINQIDRNLQHLDQRDYRLLDVPVTDRIDEFVSAYTGRPYKIGQAYYQLSKRETIQPQKQVAIVDRTGRAYVGTEARRLLGLPDEHVKVDPNHNPDYEIFVQSTSVNRKLMPNTRLLLVNS